MLRRPGYWDGGSSFGVRFAAAAHQEEPWLDFQWCQTGHEGEHVPERVTLLASRSPAKAVANGEPSYENTGRTGKAAGWWQGHEAWSNLCAGGTMGVVYGAGSLWQWALRDGRMVMAGKVDPDLGPRENVIGLPEGPSLLIFTEEPLSGSAN